MINTQTYIPYTQIVNRLPIGKGNVLYVISDILDLAKNCRENGEKFKCEAFIGTLQEAVGESGTLLFPTYSSDFLEGIVYDYHKTRGTTGALGNAALNMPGFKRTRHPSISFAVWGKDSDYLACQDPLSAYGEYSPFAYMLKQRAKAFVIGLSSLQGNSFIHVIEKTIGVEYRYEKPFTAFYINEERKISEKTYSMYVRDRRFHLHHAAQPMEQILDQLGINKCYSINGISYHLTDLCGFYEAGKLDFQYNEGRNNFMIDAKKEGAEMSDLEKAKYLNNQKRLWTLTASKGEDMVTASGWRNSANRMVFSEKEMDEVAGNVAFKLRSYLGKKECSVLEIGVGSGIILQRIAPKVSQYDAVDISPEILDACRKFNAEHCGNIRFFPMFAHEIDQLEKTYDIIIMNSIMQYFADTDYARDVLKKCKKKLRPKGVIFCGDIMDLDKKSEMIAYVTKDGIEQHNFDKVMFYSRPFFACLAKELSFARCDLSDKIYSIPNELSLFRFDAMLYL